jgi:hypothetical protein
MRVHRHFATLITLGTLASFAACAPYGHSSSEITASWDSGPLDRQYNREHDAMVARHNDEIAHPRADESRDQLDARQAAERNSLEVRYTRGKDSHMASLPPA